MPRKSSPYVSDDVAGSQNDAEDLQNGTQTWAAPRTPDAQPRSGPVRYVWYALMEMKQPAPEPFAVVSVDVRHKRDGGVEGTVVSLHMIREEAERIVHEFNEGPLS